MEPRRRGQIERAEALHRAGLDAARRARLSDALAGARDAGGLTFDYELAVAMLVEGGLSEFQVREGSMPLESLEVVARHLVEYLPGGPPLALHIGNFVGLSLAHLTASLRAHHPDALVVSVDPGMPHRGIERPDRVALRLLERFGLAANSLVITGFTRGKSLRDDGLIWPEDAVPTAVSTDVALAALGADAACQQVLPNLARFMPGRFDVAVLDGNHEADYLRRELGDVGQLLRDGGLLVLDDVIEEFWPELTAVFEGLTNGGQGYVRVAQDRRVGLLRRTSGGSS